MTEFKEGQRVKVEFEGVIERFCAHNGCTLISDEPGFNHYVLLGSSEVKVTALAPAGWPPQVGDIWGTKEGSEPETEWFARREHGKLGGMVMVSESPGWPSRVTEMFRTLNPRLVRRRGE